MNTLNHTKGSAETDREPVQQAFGKVKSLIATYGSLSVVVLLCAVVLAVAGQEVTSFMWGRSGGVLASAAVTYGLTVLAARGARWAYVRVRIITVVVPVAIVAIDLIPGALPAWFVVLQIISAVPVAAAAFQVNGATLRAAFPQSR